ncbi:MAG TPA: GNAT family N-acetyltransferase [Sphingobacteriaceae bacterium]
MIQLITIHQQMEWDQIVQKSVCYDFYHTWYYHQMSQDGEPLLVKFTDGEIFIAFPLIKRSIPNSDFLDMTCVYGYTGPISNIHFDKMDNDIKEKFKSEFLTFLKDNKYVSVFSRLNPFLNQLPLMNVFEGIHDNGQVVVIDLQEPLEKQRSRYLRGFIKKIGKLKRDGFYVKEVQNAEDIKAFVTIYSENMQLVGASSYYMFSEEYFEKLIHSSAFDCRLLMVYDHDKPVCGAIIVLTNKIIQFNFLGTLNSYRKFSPSKLLTDEIALLGRKLGMHIFNLGGGYGFQRDSLFGFKSSFSNLMSDFKSWRCIVDHKVYNELLANANIGIDQEVDFFPLYRYKALKEDVPKVLPKEELA